MAPGSRRHSSPSWVWGNLGNVGGGAVSAGAGQAAHVGALSVPQRGATLTSAVSPANAAEVETAPEQTVSGDQSTW